METTFKTTFLLENDDNIHEVCFSTDIECRYYLDRIEECHGYHEMYEIDEKDYEKQTQLFIENLSDNDLKDIINENFDNFKDDYQQVTKILTFDIK